MATIVYDFIQDSDGDLKIENNDIVIGPSNNQHVLDVMAAVPGWFKKFPLVGFNPYQYLNGKTSITAINQQAKIQLVADGNIIGPGGIAMEFDANGELKIKTIDIYRD